MSRISIHTPEEIAHRLILPLQMVQVSSATLAGFLHSGTTTSSSSHDTTTMQTVKQMRKRQEMKSFLYCSKERGDACPYLAEKLHQEVRMQRRTSKLLLLE